MIVDDHEDIREVVHVLLTNEGYQIIEAKDGKEALELLDDEIDLIILDVMMPCLLYTSILLIVLITLTIFMMSDVKKIQGNARVINYAGIIRGATQREIKLEISGNENDVLIKYLDDIFYGLINGGGKYQLTTLNDQHYQKKLTELHTSWSVSYTHLDVYKRQTIQDPLNIAMQSCQKKMTR